MSWQGLFFWLAGLCLATAAILFVVVPERAAPPLEGHARASSSASPASC